MPAPFNGFQETRVNLIEHHCRENGSFRESMGMSFKGAPVIRTINAMDRTKKQVAEWGALRVLKTNTVGVF